MSAYPRRPRADTACLDDLDLALKPFGPGMDHTLAAYGYQVERLEGGRRTITRDGVVYLADARPSEVHEFLLTDAAGVL